MKIYRTETGVIFNHDQQWSLVRNLDWDALINVDDLYAHSQALLDAGEQISGNDTYINTDCLPPMKSQELWASGVTYLRSKEERQEESKDAGGGDFYQRVYEAERPELFFKANLNRVVGHGGKVRIRKDSSWDVPEPELTLVVNYRAEIVGYTIGNDMSSRSIEGENPLYLPQAKTYDGCAALGPCIALVPDGLPSETTITLVIRRNEQEAFRGSVAISQITRRFEELVGFLFRESSFPHGALLMTGTGIVPDNNFTLASGDEITINIDGIGTLANTVA